MELNLGIFALIIMVALLLAARVGWVRDKSYDTLANVVGIAAGLTAIVALIYPFAEVNIFNRINNPLAEKDGIVWQVVFYGNKELKGPATFYGTIRGARNGLHFNIGNDSPVRKTPEDFFSATFSTTHNFLAGTYCFVTEVDDGARFFIDGIEVRDYWWGHTPGAVYRQALDLEQGPHGIQFQYFDEFENAFFDFFWYPDPGPECVTTGHPGVPYKLE